MIFVSYVKLIESKELNINNKNIDEDEVVLVFTKLQSLC